MSLFVCLRESLADEDSAALLNVEFQEVTPFERLSPRINNLLSLSWTTKAKTLPAFFA